jgi:Clp amino terminal domain, pathogenicity island component
MMFERFTQEARFLVANASEHARRLGHRYVGGEHILLAAVSASQPSSGHQMRRTATGGPVVRPRPGRLPVPHGSPDATRQA